MADIANYDRIIIGAGLYGLYSAFFCSSRGLKVAVIELDSEAFGRATYINQARVHMGYHYPRSITTAVKSAGYFRRFEDDYGFCIHSRFEQIYATSSTFSWTDATQFMEFCKSAGIRCDEVNAGKYFKDGMCDGAFLTEEYTYDARILRDYYLDKMAGLSNVNLFFSTEITTITRDGNAFHITAKRGEEIYEYETSFILNATYASVNQIIRKVFPQEVFKIKYELCEIILCEPSDRLKNIGITVMDGPFFSIMPFGKTKLHSLTSVTFTPHKTCYDDEPMFQCQEKCECNRDLLMNCNTCIHKPKSAWEYMSHLANKYMRDEYSYTYRESLFSMKPILKNSEVDDSRPTAIRVHLGGRGKCEPTFISVLSGKINTIYDLDSYLI